MTDRPDTEAQGVTLPVLNAEPEGARWGRAHHILLYFLIAGFIGWLLSGFYQVEAGQVGIVERMGEVLMLPPAPEGQPQAKLVETGLHYGLPWPLDLVHAIPINRNLTATVKDFSTPADASEKFKRIWRERGVTNEELDAWFDPYLITSDKNVVNAQIAVQYKITDPYAYFMSISHGTSQNPAQILDERQGIIKQVGAHVLIREVARTPVDSALQGGNGDVTQRIKAGIQEETDRLHLGIDIVDVTLEKIHWPARVDAAFNGVLQARAQSAQAKDIATAYAESLLTNARTGESSRVRSEAQAYAARVENQAQGEANRFMQVYVKYQAAPDLTRLSLYSDAVNTILQNVSRVVLALPGQQTHITLDPVDEKARAVDRAAAQAAPQQAGPRDGNAVGQQERKSVINRWATARASEK